MDQLELSKRDKAIIYHLRIAALFYIKTGKPTGKPSMLDEHKIMNCLSSKAIERNQIKRQEWHFLRSKNLTYNNSIWKFDEYHIAAMWLPF